MEFCQSEKVGTLIYCQSHFFGSTVGRISSMIFMGFFCNISNFRDIWRMVCPVQPCMTLANDLDTETWSLVVTKSC